MATQAQITAVQQLYVSYLGRAADKAGLDFWSNAIANGTSTIESVATGLTLATEYTTAYGNLSNDALVDAVYTNVLGRPADAAGKAFWVAAFGNGTVKADTFVASLIQSLGAQDQATINNKTFVAQTYTDTVGDAYTPAGATTVIQGVTFDPATVTAKIDAINAGTYPGQVVGLGLINAVTAAQASDAAYETANKAALDALATKLNVTVGTDFDAELTSVSAAADQARGAIGGGAATEVLAANVVVDKKAVDTSFAGLDTAGKTAATAYQSAVNANAALKAADTTQVAAVEAGLKAADVGGVALTAAGTAAGQTFADTTALYAFYTKATTTDAQRTAIEKSYTDAKVDYIATFKATATVDVTKNAAIAKETAATSAADAGYVSASAKLVADTKTLADAQAADVNKTAADGLVKSNAASEKTVADANDAITAFNNNTSNTDSKIVALTGATVSADAAVKETFYFSSKVAATNDIAFGTTTASTHFGAGDSIVLGSGVTYNSGALSTGDNNKAEFFLVQKGSDTLVVVETAAFGSSTTLHTATGDTAAVTSPDAAVITLTGVNVADVTVNNGVISHVA